mmetsp:Transcript_2578/g.3929  ORF Transcript_2578/g.3929 Transcript_2578/m.3929 type:complete len:336 (+) Transcript_2578:120-1127(+)
MERLCALFKEAKADKSLGVAYFEAEAGRIIGPSTEDVAKYLISNFDHLESSYVDSIKEKDLDDGEDDGRGGDNDEEDSDEERSRGGRDNSDERRDTSRAFETEHREWNQNDGSNNTGNSVRELHSRGSEEKEKRNRGNDVGANMILCCNLPDDCIETDVHEIFTRADVPGVSVYFCGSNYAVVELADKKNRDQALAKCSGAKVRSRLVELSAMETRKRIFIGNIPKRMSQSEIEKEFEAEGGRFDRLYLKSGYCFISYQTAIRAHRACRKLKKFSLAGTRLTVEFAKPLLPNDSSSGRLGVSNLDMGGVRMRAADSKVGGSSSRGNSGSFNSVVK